MRISKLSLFFAPVAALPVLAQTFVTFSVPGATGGTVPYAINDNGDVTGTWADSAAHGFVRSAAGAITAFDPPQSVNTYATAINAAGVITGLFLDKNFSQHGFVRNAKGAIESFDVPGGIATGPNAVNASGEITGTYLQNGATQGFVRSPDGSITTFTTGTGTAPFAINNHGAIAGTEFTSGVGFVRDPTGVIHAGKPIEGVTTYVVTINNQGAIAGSLLARRNLGFVRTVDGPIEDFSINGSPNTAVTGINSSNNTAGQYIDPQTGATRSFLRDADGTVTLIDCPGFFETAAVSINTSGQIAGFVSMADPINPVGFVYLP